MHVSGLFPDPVDSEYRNARIPWTRTAFQADDGAIAINSSISWPNRAGMLPRST